MRLVKRKKIGAHITHSRTRSITRGDAKRLSRISHSTEPVHAMQCGKRFLDEERSALWTSNRLLQTAAQPQRQQTGLLTMRCLLDSRIIGAAVTARRLLCWHRSPWSPPFTQRTYYISHTCPHTANPMDWDRRDVPDAGDSADRRASAAADTGSTISGPYFWSLCSTSRPSVFRMTTGALSSSVTCTWSFPKNSRRKEWPGLIVFPMMHAWLVSNV